MSQPIDVAYVDVRALNLDKFERDLDRSVEQALRDVDRTVKSATDDIAESFGGAVDEVEEELEKLTDSVERESIEQRREFTRTTNSITSGFTRAFNDVDESFKRVSESVRGRSRGLDRAVQSFTGGIANNVASQAADAAGQSVVRLGSAFSGLASVVAPLQGLMSGLLAAALIALVPIILAVTAALSNLVALVTLLPGLLGFLVAAVTPLVIAFQNFGGAVAALASGDIDKINEALKKLSPSARAVALEVAGMIPRLKDLQLAVQESFFKPLRGIVGLITSEVLPVVKLGFSQIAGSLGGLSAEFGKLLANSDVLEALGDLFEFVASVIKRSSPTLIAFFGTLVGVMEHSLPFLDRFFKVIGAGFTKVTDFLGGSLKTGDFEKFLEKAFSVAKDLFDLLGAGFDLVKTILKDMDDEGQDFIKTLTEMLRGMTEFLKSPTGQDILSFIAATVPVIADVIKATLATMGVYLTILVTIVKSIIAFVKFLGDAGKAIGSFAVKVKNGLVDVWNDVKEGVAKGFNAVVDFFVKLPGRIGEQLAKLPGLINDFIVATVDNMLLAIGVGIGLVIFLFTEFPKQVAEVLTELPGKVGAFFTDLWNRAFELSKIGVAAVLEFFRTLPTRIGEFLATSARVVGEWFTNMWNTAKEKTIAGTIAVIDFIKSVPGKLVALGVFFVDAGRKLITGFINALKGSGSLAGDLGSAIVRSIKGLLNNVISRVNDGIASIDNKLPGNLPRIPLLNSGGVTLGAPLAQLHPNEAVIPLDDPRALARLREANIGGGSTSITFEPGAVVVTFEGALPSRTEAAQVGRTVGSGIADALLARNVQVSVRSI